MPPNSIQYMIQAQYSIPMQPQHNKHTNNQEQENQSEEWRSRCFVIKNDCWPACQNCNNNKQKEEEGVEEGVEEDSSSNQVSKSHYVSEELMSQQSGSANRVSQTICHLIEGITFDKKKSIRKNYKDKSQTSSRSSLSSYDAKQPKNDQSKSWTKQQQTLFLQLVQKYGTDFNFIKQYFPKKSKSQIKSRYKQLANMKKKSHKKVQNKKQKVQQGLAKQQTQNDKKEKEEQAMQQQVQVKQIKEANQDQSENEAMR